jgi:hypothetical protein
MTQRDRHLEMITKQGRLAWQAATGYGRRSLVETTMGRYKALIGPRLRARGLAAQSAEASIGVAVLNRTAEIRPVPTRYWIAAQGVGASCPPSASAPTLRTAPHIGLRANLPLSVKASHRKALSWSSLGAWIWPCQVIVQRPAQPMLLGELMQHAAHLANHCNPGGIVDRAGVKALETVEVPFRHPARLALRRARRPAFRQAVEFEMCAKGGLAPELSPG